MIKPSPWCIQEGKSIKLAKTIQAQVTEELEDNCHVPDLVQAFSEENDRLNLVLQCTKPPTCMAVVYGSK